MKNEDEEKLICLVWNSKLEFAMGNLYAIIFKPRYSTRA